MVEKMMRVGGKDNKGIAKAFKTTNDGSLIVNNANKKSLIIGEYKEPYDEGYVGNITVSGLEVFDKIEVTEKIRDASLGVTGIYIAHDKKVRKYTQGYDNEEQWTYSEFIGTQIEMVRLDYQDNVFVVGFRNAGERVIEKVDGKTGLRLWRNIDTNRAGVAAQETVVDKNGDLYASGMHDSKDRKTGEIVKYSGVSGEIMWRYTHTNPIETLQWFVGIDKENHIYLSHNQGILKLNQTSANTSTPPTVIWNYVFRHENALGGFMYIKIDLKGFIYRIERTYDWNYGNPIIKSILVKIDQSGSTPQVLWTRELVGEADGTSRIFIDENGVVYHNSVGKVINPTKDYWGDIPPFTITDIRDGCLLGFKEVLGYNNDIRYELYKTGKDLQAKNLMGVK